MDANIIHISQENKNNIFNLRIIVKGLFSQNTEENMVNKEKEIKKILEEDLRFTTSHIV